jgi:hypothetical protein
MKKKSLRENIEQIRKTYDLHYVKVASYEFQLKELRATIGRLNSRIAVADSFESVDLLEERTKAERKLAAGREEILRHKERLQNSKERLEREQAKLEAVKTDYMTAMTTKPENYQRVAKEMHVKAVQLKKDAEVARTKLRQSAERVTSERLDGTSKLSDVESARLSNGLVLESDRRFERLMVESHNYSSRADALLESIAVDQKKARDLLLLHGGPAVLKQADKEIAERVPLVGTTVTA